MFDSTMAAFTRFSQKLIYIVLGEAFLHYLPIQKKKLSADFLFKLPLLLILI